MGLRGPAKQAVGRWTWVRSWPQGASFHILPEHWRSVLCKAGVRNRWVAVDIKTAKGTLCAACQRELEWRA